MRELKRYSDGDRVKHWAVALLFILAGLSGLAFFHPAFYFFTNLFGGGPWTRILHPFLGVAMVLVFAWLFMHLRADNRMTEADREWRRNMGALVRGDEASMPPVGKYNAGQKIVFWVIAWCLLVLLATGVIFWRPWFAEYFPILAIRIAVVLHSIAAVVLVLTIIVHVYAAIWVRGSVRAMTRGTVSEAWARQHHALWHREMTRGK